MIALVKGPLLKNVDIVEFSTKLAAPQSLLRSKMRSVVGISFGSVEQCSKQHDVYTRDCVPFFIYSFPWGRRKQAPHTADVIPSKAVVSKPTSNTK